MSDAGHKIIKGLKAALAGDFARVTIEGQVWERRDTLMPGMFWERAESAKIDRDAYYVVQHNGHEWRDFDLAVLHGALVEKHLGPTWVRGRPEWIAKIVRPTPPTAQQGQ